MRPRRRAPLATMLMGGPRSDDIVASKLVTNMGVGATVVRAATRLVENAAGLVVSIAANLPAVDAYGLNLSGDITNPVIQNRDLTQAGSWTLTNGTAARCTGADGVASAGSTFTATADAATCFQTLTLAAANRRFSLYARRRTGTGAFSMTNDGGSTYTAKTLTSSWARFDIIGSVLNPVCGFKLATSGDEVDIDLVFYSSRQSLTPPIATTTGSVTTAGDVVTIPNPLADADVYWSMEARINEINRSTATVGRTVFRVGAGAAGAANTALLSLNPSSIRMEVYDSAAASKIVRVDSMPADGSLVTFRNMNGTLSILYNGVAQTQVAESSAGTGIITTQPASIYLGVAVNTAYLNTAMKDIRISNRG